MNEQLPNPNNSKYLERYEEVLKAFMSLVLHFVDVDENSRNTQKVDNLLNTQEVDNLLNILYTAFRFLCDIIKQNKNIEIAKYREILIDLVLFMPMVYEMPLLLNRERLAQYIDLVIENINNLSDEAILSLDQTFENLLEEYANKNKIQIPKDYSIFSFNNSDNSTQLKIIKKLDLNNNIRRSIIIYVSMQVIKNKIEGQSEMNLTNSVLSIFLKAMSEIICPFSDPNSINILKFNLNSANLIKFLDQQTIDNLISVLNLLRNGKNPENQKDENPENLEVGILFPDWFFNLLENFLDKINENNTDNADNDVMSKIKEALESIFDIVPFDPFQES